MSTKTSPARDSKGRYISSKGKSTKKPTKISAKKKLTTVAPTKKNYIGISRDHSGSMRAIAAAAARDYNNNIQSIREANEAEKQDTIVSVVKCGVDHAWGHVERETTLSTVSKLVPLGESLQAYGADGSDTPLFDSVGELIEQFEKVPDAKDPNVAFLIMVITDGQNNKVLNWDGRRLARKIAELQATDHWTFAFRVPRPSYGLNYKQDLVNLGIPADNILEWEQTTRGVEIATQATNTAFRSFYRARTAGATSTKGFYTTDLSNVSKQTVKAKLVDISNEVEFFTVNREVQIRPFVESQIGTTMNKGGAFYQLTKKEDEVQDYKQIAIRDKKSGHVYSGVEARNILGLPHNGTHAILPGNHGAYDIFIQSTSVNRKLLPGTQIMYWSKVGTAFQS